MSDEIVKSDQPAEAKVEGKEISNKELFQHLDDALRSGNAESEKLRDECRAILAKVQETAGKAKEEGRDLTGEENASLDEALKPLQGFEDRQKEILNSHKSIMQLQTRLIESNTRAEQAKAFSAAVLTRRVDKAVGLQLRATQYKAAAAFLGQLHAVNGTLPEQLREVPASALMSDQKDYDKFMIAKEKEHTERTGQVGGVGTYMNLGAQEEATGVLQPSGGYFVIPEISNVVENTLREMGSMRQVATMETVTTDRKKWRTRTGHTDSGWVGKDEPRPKTKTTAFDETVIEIHKQYAEPQLEEDYVEDSVINAVEEVMMDLTETFMIAESKAFISGSGHKEPRGFLDYADGGTAQKVAKHTDVLWEKLGWVPSGDNNKLGPTASGTASPADGIITLEHSMDRRYRMGAVFMMNNATLMGFRKMVDGDGNLIYGSSNITEGRGETLYGRPVLVDDFMPDVAADAFPVAMIAPRAYYILDRRGMKITRDAGITTRDVLKLYTTKRCGGGVRFFPRIRLLKITS